MYSIEIFNHETEKYVKRVSFATKKEAKQFMFDNCEKRGYDYFQKGDRSLEYSFLF